MKKKYIAMLNETEDLNVRVEFFFFRRKMYEILKRRTSLTASSLKHPLVVPKLLFELCD